MLTAIACDLPSAISADFISTTLELALTVIEMEDDYTRDARHELSRDTQLAADMGSRR
jgi:hypothetical protein